MSDIDSFYSYECNIEAVCPYQTDFYWTFNWYRDERGLAIIEGYDPEDDPDIHWLCACGHYVTWGGHCDSCGIDAPWGCDCGECAERRMAEYYDDIAEWIA